jgi:hypothetical protein
MSVPAEEQGSGRANIFSDPLIAERAAAERPVCQNASSIALGGIAIHPLF